VVEARLPSETERFSRAGRARQGLCWMLCFGQSGTLAMEVYCGRSEGHEKGQRLGPASGRGFGEGQRERQKLTQLVCSALHCAEGDLCMCREDNSSGSLDETGSNKS
jgi:hypothetical protein